MAILKVKKTLITLDPALEQMLIKSIQAARQSGVGVFDSVIEPSLAQKLQTSISEAAKKQEMEGKPAVLLVSNTLRSLLSKLARFAHSEISVLAFNEIPSNKEITIEATIS